LQNWEVHSYGGFDMRKDAAEIYLPSDLDDSVKRRIEKFAKGQRHRLQGHWRQARWLERGVQAGPDADRAAGPIRLPARNSYHPAMLTLEEIKSLVVALGVQIPEDILTQRAKAEEFSARREKVAAEGGAKPADWRLKANFDDTLKRAVDATGQQQFDAALKLLDEAGQLLQQPDTPPPASATAASAPTVEQTSAASNNQEFLRAWAAAKAAWTSAIETVDTQLGKLQQALNSSDDEELREIGEFGVNGVTGNFKVPLLAVMQDLESAADDARGAHARRAAKIAAGFLKHIESATRVQACDENPFGVQVSIRKTLGGALAQLNDALKMASPT
jgi:hypothetical protein